MRKKSLLDLETEIMDLCQEYWDKNNGGNAVVWIRNDDTGQTLIYTRGEYSDTLINTVDNLI